MHHDEHGQRAKRKEVLALLYTERMQYPNAGWMALCDFCDALGEYAFAISVLEEVGHIKRHNFHYRITGSGVLAHEASE